MKALLFVSGLLIGAVVTFFVSRCETDAPRSTTRTVDGASEDKKYWHPKERKSHSFNYHEPIFLTSASGKEYRLYIHGSMGSPLRYEWRSTSDLFQKGSGRLFEKHVVIRETVEGVELRDDGSELVIMIGDHHLEWSPRDQSSGWLYFDASETAISNKNSG